MIADLLYNQYSGSVCQEEAKYDNRQIEYRFWLFSAVY